MGKKIILYGPSKIGITGFLSDMTSAETLYIIPFPGKNILEKRYLKGIQSFTADKDKIELITNALESILKLKDPTFKYIVLEHLTAFETLISNVYMSIHNVHPIEYFAYNRGHQATFSALLKMLYLLEEIVKNKNITVILTAHATKQEYYSLFVENASRDIILSTIKHSDATTHEHLKIWSDALLYVNNTSLATGGFLTNGTMESSSVSIFTREHPNFDAGCRFLWPNTIDLNWNTFEEYLNKDN